GIIEKWDYTTAAINGYMMRLNSANYLSFAVCGPANNTGISTAPRAITTNTWTHVACTYDSLTQAMTMYVNGVADPTTGSNVTGAPTDGVSDLHIGADYGANNFGGNIDEARIYSRSLSQPEVDVLRTMVQPPATSPLILGGNQVDLSWTAPTNAGSVNVVYSI